MARTGSWKNRLIQSLVKAAAPRRTAGCIERLLVVSTTALGDTLWATPALVGLKQVVRHLAVLTSPIGYQALQHHPAVDALHLLREPMLLKGPRLLRALKQERFDAALVFHASQRLALPLCALAGIPRIIGTTGINKGLDALLTDPISPVFEHEIERRLRLAEALGAPRLEETLSYVVTQAEREVAKRYVSSMKRPIVAIHPGSKEPFRRWPIDCFAKTVAMLQERFDAQILLTGTKEELPLLAQLQKQIEGARLVEPGSIRLLAAILEQVDLLLSNDTGPFHLACALSRPAVGLYVSTDARLCGPHKANNAVAISKEPTCLPCLKRKCERPFCFLQISPQEVFEECAKWLTTAASYRL